MRELAVGILDLNENVNAFQTIDAIKKAGFKNVFVQWYNKDWNPTQKERLDYARRNGLNVIFAHLGYKDINDIWVEGETGDRLAESYKNDILVCKENEIPLVIMHLNRHKIAPKYNEIGLKRLQEIADFAQKLNIKIAFENTKLKGYLEYVIENIQNENVGICFDSGHYHVHFNDELDFSKFKNRIFAVHLHDNDKSDDLHLIPFDGTINWENIVSNLKENNYDGPITLEVCYRYDYLSISIDEFYNKSYNAALKLSNMF